MVVEHDDTEQAHLCLGWRSLADRRRRPLGAGRGQPGPRRRHGQPAVPGGPRGARAWRTPCTRTRRAYGDAGSLTIYCGTAPKRAREALRGDRRRRRRRCSPTASPTRELAVAAGYLEGSLLLGLEDSGGRMGRLGRSLMQRGRADHRRRAARRRSAPSPPTTCTRVLRRVLDGPRALAAVGPVRRSSDPRLTPHGRRT